MSAPRPVLLAGPTASGKSRLALALARQGAGMVINADSQQVLAGWRVLTARPSAAEEAACPHRLYGHVPPGRASSVGAWLRDLAPVLEEARAAGLRPILVGGTGLYFRAVTEGLAEIPPVPAGLRAEIEARLAAHGRDALAAELAGRDPETAARIDLANPRRVARALEVLEATGEGLARWQARTPAPMLSLAQTVPAVLETPREILAERIGARFAAMLEGGALEEARAIAAAGLPAHDPHLRPVGARELLAHLAGDMTLEAAAERAIAATRAYAKRQRTWFDNRMRDWPRLDATRPEAAVETMLARVREA